MKRTLLLDSLLLAVLTSILILPLFRLKYADNWTSIESTFIADARMLENNLPHPGWQPLWYCGTRFDYIYPPALRYGTALIAKVGGLSTARAYHLYTAIFYVLGIVGIYWLVRIGSGSRWAALLAAIASALLSPSFLLLPLTRGDSTYWVPQRLHTLALYGEGPHISALCVLPFALAATFLALRRWRPIVFSLSGLLCALVVANNFYGATALAIFFPAVVWSVWVGEQTWQIWIRATGIVLLSYGLSAFWLTPSYLRVTLMDLKYVSQPGNTLSTIAGLVLLAILCLITWRFGNKHKDREWTVFVTCIATLIVFSVLGFFYLGFRLIGEPARLIPELDLALILVCVLALQVAWKQSRLRLPVALFIALAFVPSLRYVRHAWSPFPKAGSLESAYDYQMTKWIHDHLPEARVLPSGTVRFWYDAWFDNAQTDGGSNQGLLNQVYPAAAYQIHVGDHADLTTLWLQALGTDAIVVPGKVSREYYVDFHTPDKFVGHAPVLYDDHQGTRIYRIPRVHPSIGRIVDKQNLQSVGPVRGGDDVEILTKYVSIIEAPSQPLTSVTWRGFDEVDLHAQTAAGQSVLLQETYDPAWHAYEGGKPLNIRLEPVMSFMLIDVPPGEHQVQMRFETPLENRVGQALFVLSILCIGGLCAMSFRQRFTTANLQPS